MPPLTHGGGDGDGDVGGDDGGAGGVVHWVWHKSWSALGVVGRLGTPSASRRQFSMQADLAASLGA